MQIKPETFYKNLPFGPKIVHRKTDSQVAYVGIMVQAGTRDEEERLGGMAHYIEHCVFKGCRMNTPNRVREVSSREIINRIEGVGGEINAYTTKEETTYYAATPYRHFASTLKLIASMIMQPTFPKKETDKELQVILDEIDSYEDSPSELIYDDFEGMIFQGHPLAMPILGTSKTLHKIARDSRIPQTWLQAHYRPERMVVFTEGKMSFESVLRAVEALPWDALTSRQPLANLSEKAPLSLPANLGPKLYRKHTHQTHVMLGGLAYPLGHPNQLGLYLLNNILGGGAMSSMLNLSLREQYGLVYTIESQYTPLSDTGYWSIYFASDVEDKERCLELITKCLETLRSCPISESRWRKSLEQLHGQMAISAENKENSVLAMAKMVLYHGYAAHWEETYEKVTHFTPERLQQIAQEIYAPDNIRLLAYE